MLSNKKNVVVFDLYILSFNTCKCAQRGWTT